MSRRRLRLIPLALAIVIASAGTASAQYGYGQDDGFFLFVDAAFMAPKDTDQVMAYTTTDVLGPPQNFSASQFDWDASVTAQLEFGYQWANGNRLSVVYWQFDDDQTLTGAGAAYGFANFTTGPGIYYYGYYYGTNARSGSWDFKSNLKASTIDVMWGNDYEATDNLDLGWSLGLRFAQFEETIGGTHDFYSPNYPSYYNFAPGSFSYADARSNEGTAAGFKVGGRADYSFTDLFSIDAGIGFSLLDGEVTSASTVIPIGPCNTDVNGPCIDSGFNFNLQLPSASFDVKDEDRTGQILDFDVNFVFHFADDRYRLRFGYVHTRWDGLAADLTRNLPGTFVGQPSRDSVAFSGFRIGVGFLF